MTERTLGARVLRWLAVYVVLLTVMVAAGANLLHERSEHLVWRALLKTELAHFIDTSARDPHYRWQNSDTLSLYRFDAVDRIPASLEALNPGLHDNLVLANRNSVALVRDTQAFGRVAIVLDVTDFEALERFTSTWVLLAVLLIGTLTLFAAWYGMRRIVGPLSTLAARIGELDPEQAGGRVAPGAGATSELVVIADALNAYLQRNEAFVERERVFVGSASHELRTPIAVIAGAADLALEQAQLPAAARAQVQRIQRTARGVEQLLSLLLMLARDPQRLSRESDRFRLDELLPVIVDDHRHLCADKELTIAMTALAPCVIVAPLVIVQAAIGNLLRNAIENSDRGDIVIRLDAPGIVAIDDPGHGMSPEDISAIYARTARDGGGSGGIGLDLIARLCQHLGWRLSIGPRSTSGTRAMLDFGKAPLDTKRS